MEANPPTGVCDGLGTGHPRTLSSRDFLTDTFNEGRVRGEP